MAFNDQQRIEIFEYHTWLIHRVGFFRQSYKFEEIETLRTGLLESCRNIDRLIREARTTDNFTSRFLALSAYLGAGSATALNELARTARSAGFRLKEAKGLTAHVVDVRSERAYLLQEALAMARGPGGGGEESWAKSWGLNPSPRSGPFRRFLAALIGIDEPTEDEMRNALRAIERKRERKGGNKEPE